jgi:hypothetical protein
MSSISLLVSINKDGVAKLMDETAYKLAPDQLERAAEWTPGTEIIVQETDNETWKYKLLSSGGGIPVSAAPYTPGK